MSKDLFSSLAAGYAQYRPGYPDALIQAVLEVTPKREKVWDCATGSGQAAILLAPHFQHVEATDLSARQLQQAPPYDNIIWSKSPAEKTPFADNTFDCITVAQAYHWLDFDAFHLEAVRTAQPNATIAIWGYGLIKAPTPAIRQHIDRLYVDILGPWWDPERKYIDESYHTVPFDFEEYPRLNFEYPVDWSHADLLGYLNTWSSLKNFRQANNYNPLDQWALELDNIWPSEQTLPFSFPLFLRRGAIRKT